MASLIICEGSTLAPSCNSCCGPLTYRGKRGRAPAYCSPSCFPSRSASRRPAHERACAECGKQFATPSSKTVCCSPACGHARGKRLGDITRSARAAERNHRTCERCGARFQKVRGSLGLYCSKACTADAARIYASPQEAKRAERQRWKERTGWRPVERAPAKDPAPKPARQCAECSAVFTPAYGDKRRTFCSDKCSTKVARRIAGKNHRKRARHHGVAYEPVSRVKLFERDRWRCQVCGVRTPKRLMGSIEPNAPEMDHRIPMAMGGPHTWANLQCACRRCNGAKGGTIIVGQLPLFAVPA